MADVWVSVNVDTKGANLASGLVLEGRIAELREREVRLLYDAAEFVGKISPEGQADRQRLRDAANDLREMFLLVTIIGEFNAGKSTFVNALIGEPLLPVGITPTTDMIEVIRYAPAPSSKPTVREGSSVREWAHPNTGGEGVAIVDTPGSGSVFKKHEEIAKSFLHRSDLVIFLLNARRAFADTERLYLELAKSYGKKIIVVINQADLLEERERAEVKKFVQQQIDQLLNLRPPIFLVSAKKALHNQKQVGLPGARREIDDSGMSEVRAHLRAVFEQVPPARQKLQTRLDLLRSILERHREAINGRLSLIGHDTDAAEALQREIEAQAAGLDRQLASALSEAKDVLARVRERGMEFVEGNINVVRATLRGIDKERLAKQFESDVLGDALTRLSSAQEHYVGALVDGSRAYWRGVIERLTKLEALLRDEAIGATGMDAAAYADQRAALQTALTMANIEMKAYSDERLINEIEKEFEQNVRSFTYGAVSGIGGVVAVLLSIAGAAAPGALPPLAAIGFVLGIPAMLLGGGAAVLIWRRAVANARKQLVERVNALETSYQESLTRLTTDERNRLVQYGKQILAPVFSQLQALGTRFQEQQKALDTFVGKAADIETELSGL